MASLWDSLKSVRMSSVLIFSNAFVRSLNATSIAHIPKKIGAKEVHDCRPISPLGSFYKILSKVLAGRLKKIIEKLGSTHQLAFIKGKQIIYAHTHLLMNVKTPG